MIVILIGTMSSGKTMFGQKLARELRWPFFEADTFHSAANKEKMRAGTPLTDEDRQPWLEAIATEIKKIHAEEKSAIFTCSALKKKYRDTLRGAWSTVKTPDKGRPLLFIHLYAPKEILHHRAATRQHEYMNPNLIQSQLDTLEFPGPDETDVISINTDASAKEVLQKIISAIREHTSFHAPRP